MGLQATMLGENLERHMTSVALISNGIAHSEQIHFPLTKWMPRYEVVQTFRRWQHCHKCLLCIMASCTRKTITEEQYNSPSLNHVMLYQTYF